MNFPSHNRAAQIIAALAIMLGAGLFAIGPAEADIAPSPCPGNVCTGNVVVGGQNVNYYYTQHIRPNGTLKVRLNGGLYNTAQLISFIVHGLPAFSSWGKYSNPSGTPLPIFLPVEDVNPGRTAYERRDNAGCAGCVVDQVMTVTYSGLAAGAYSFNLTIVQNGSTGGLLNLPFYVDANAPNTDESYVWNAIAGMDFPCADGIDNDLSYAKDCADPACNGSVGRVSDGALCQTVETNCYDGFDNDGNGKADCLDPSCDGRLGRQTPPAYCQFGNEKGIVACHDGFDNDGDGKADCLDNVTSPPGGPASDSCWQNPAYGCPAVETSCTNGIDDNQNMSYQNTYDANPLTGVDCQDYSCAGNPACPSNERKTAAGVAADAQCFDGIDNDLDGKIDCADPDCSGVVNPADSSQVCREKEFDLAAGYQYCANNFDDNGDGPKDCADPSCKRAFGNCGPCPAREDYTFQSCADGKDNDSDGVIDCKDADCYGNYGTLGNAAKCAATETGALCSDGFDNDGNGLADCADPSCAGSIGPHGEICQVHESSCSDGQDNDADGYADCLDPDCWGVGTCRAKSWANAACRIIPEYSGYVAFTSSSPTVTARVETSSYANPGAGPATVELRGTASYDSISMIVGDNIDPAKYYPYADPSCTLTGSGSGQMSFLAVAGHAVQIVNNNGQVISNFDVTLNCATPSVPAAQKTYPISVSVLKTGNVPEYGEANFNTTLYEHTAPSVVTVEQEAASPIGTVLNVPYNSSRAFRIVPDDPGVGLATSGICRCSLRFIGSGTTFSSPDGDCRTAKIPFVGDGSYQVSATAEDGAGNVSPAWGPSVINVNVTPALTTPLDLVPTGAIMPFFKAGRTSIDLLNAEFYTGMSNTFNATCDVLVRDSGGAIIGGPGPSATIPGVTFGSNRIKCIGTFDLASLPVGMPDGEYYVTVRVHDDGGDYLESNRKVIVMCNHVPGPNDPESVCSKADFDDDGTPEGLYTTLYSSVKRSCDNCVGLPNDQTDNNANGIGDACEPKQPWGRCEIDTSQVCSCSSDPAIPCGTGGIRCPGPSIDDIPGAPPGTKKDPQACKDTWGVCKFGGAVGFTDQECNFCAGNVAIGCRLASDCVASGTTGPCDAGKGKCSDGVTACRRAADCVAAGKTGPCTGGKGLCADGVTACIRDVDCSDAGVAGPCVGANILENMLTPWLQTKFGSIFSKTKITAPDTPPPGQFNATYCITAKDQVLNFQSQACAPATGELVPQTRFDRPKPENSYSTVLGRIDVPGLLSGRYGTVVNLQPDLSNLSLPLAGQVYVVQGQDLTISAPLALPNGALGGKAGGTILVKGGNLIINSNVTYGSTPINSLKELASVGWIVLDADAGQPGYGTKGNIYIGPAVTEVSGAFFAGGQSGVYTVWPADALSDSPLKVYGVMVARAFRLRRGYKSTTAGSEQFIYDGRAIADPPPGFADVTKSLPLFRDSAP